MTDSSNIKFIQHSSRLKIGDKAPNFKGEDQNGKLIQLSDFFGKDLVLYFYPKDNTPTCTIEACNLRDNFDYLLKHNYSVAGVSADSVKSHAKFATKQKLPFPLIADEKMEIIKAFDVWGTKKTFGKIYDGIVRTSFIIDSNGLIKDIIHDVKSKEHAQQILSR